MKKFAVTQILAYILVLCVQWTLISHLSLSQYGEYDYLLYVASFLANMYIFGHDSAYPSLLLQQYHGRPHSNKVTVISSIITSQIPCLALAIVVFIAVNVLYPQFVFTQNSFWVLLLLSIAIWIADNLITICIWLQSPIPYALLLLGQPLSFLLLLFLNFLTSTAAVSTTSSLLLLSSVAKILPIFLLVYIYRIRITKPAPKAQYVSSARRMAIPAGLSVLSAMLLPLLDRLFIENSQSLTYLGTYALASKVNVLFAPLTSILSTVVLPKCLIQLNKHSKYEHYSLLIKSVILLCSLIALLISCLFLQARLVLPSLAKYEELEYALPLMAIIQASLCIDISNASGQYLKRNMYPQLLSIGLASVIVLLLGPSILSSYMLKGYLVFVSIVYVLKTVFMLHLSSPFPLALTNTIRAHLPLLTASWWTYNLVTFSSQESLKIAVQTTAALLSISFSYMISLSESEAALAYSKFSTLLKRGY